VINTDVPMKLNFSRTIQALQAYDLLLEYAANKAVKVYVAQQLEPIITGLMQDVVHSFALDTGQDCAYAKQVFSRGDISSIRYAVSCTSEKGMEV